MGEVELRRPKNGENKKMVVTLLVVTPLSRIHNVYI